MQTGNILAELLRRGQHRPVMPFPATLAPSALLGTVNMARVHSPSQTVQATAAHLAASSCLQGIANDKWGFPRGHESNRVVREEHLCTLWPTPNHLALQGLKVCWEHPNRQHTTLFGCCSLIATGLTTTFCPSSIGGAAGAAGAAEAAAAVHCWRQRATEAAGVRPEVDRPSLAACRGLAVAVTLCRCCCCCVQAAPTCRHPQEARICAAILGGLEDAKAFNSSLCAS